MRDIKIGHAVGKAKKKDTPSRSASDTSQSFANQLEKFPSPRIPPLGLHRIPNIPPSDYRRMTLNQAVVKQVLSGDSLLLASKSGSERTLSLAYCTSPHLKKEGDDRWAFASREALRSIVIGKTVKFSVLYQIPNTKREYGIVYLEDGRRLPEEMLSEGWLKLREDAGRKEDTEEALQQLNSLRLLEARARAEDKGLWASSGGYIDVQHDMGDPQTFLDSWKGKTVDGLVERVLSGDRMLVRLLISPEKHILVMTLVAGIRAPTTERTNPSNNTVQPAEEFGDEARKFVETRLLHRDVKIDILGLSPQNQLIAAVKHPKMGSIAKYLLKDGLARCTDFHSILLGSEMATLREAEKEAQAAKKGQFKDHVAKAASPGGNLDCTVTRVFSADVIYVRNRAGVEKRINLSSIRGPKQTDPAESPFRDEAKEYLRKRLIGKQVRMSLDGSRPANGEYDAKEAATITFNDKNVALLLVQEGWCSVIRHKRDDTDRSPDYDELLAAQEAAKEASKGMWSGKPSKAKTYLDASENLTKAKQQLGSLQRQKRIPAVVDFVKGGSRFVVLIPREGVKLNFVLGGIKAPKSARNPTEKAEPFGQEAHDLAFKRLSQRDVEVNVLDIDKNGGFIGEIFVNKESFAKILVEEGYASVHPYSAEKAGNSAELFAAEQRAKDARKGIWHSWDPSQDVSTIQTDTSNGDTPHERQVDYREVMLTNMDDDGKLKIQIVGAGTTGLETLMAQFSTFHMSSSNSAGLPGPPKAGEYVAAKFSADGNWYRGRIRSNDRAAKIAEVVYIDYGNSEKIPWAKLRPLTQPQFTKEKLKPQAVDALLSFVSLPPGLDYRKDAINFIDDIASNRRLVANVDHTDSDGTLYITLYDPDNTKDVTHSINAEIIAEGWAMVPKKLKAWERVYDNVLAAYTEKMEAAKNSHLGMWEYGDITED